MEKNILVRNLQKSYGPIVVFENFSFSLKAGESLAIEGESGSGKTSLLHMLCGLEQVGSGDIFIFGEEISAMTEQQLSLFRRQNMGFIFQEHYLLNDFSCIDNLLLPIKIAKKEITKIDKEKALEMLQKIKLINREKYYPKELSGGERQRLAIAQALIHEPKIILADEPTGNLDLHNKEEISRMLFEMVAEYKKTLILSTHSENLSNKCLYRIKLEK